jgi:tripartite-type tricarboxylate transporter receptor subunit TctC
MKRILGLAFLFTASALSAFPASRAAAQNYPARPIRIVVPFPAGSGADLMARTVGAKLTERWGQQVLADARPGASGVIAAELVLQAPADGYTVMLGSSSSHAANVSTRRNLSYDPLRDFSPVSLIARVPMLVLAHPSMPVNSARELIAFAKARPGQVTYGTAGNGTTAHLATELFKFMAKVDLVHVPYRGSPQAMIDGIAGQVSLVVVPIVTGMPHVRAGRLKALAVTTPNASPIAPEVPPLAAAGLPGYDATLWYGLFLRSGTPRDIVNRLGGEVANILRLGDVGETLRKQGAEPAGNTPEEFTAMVKSEIMKWAKVVKASGITVN